MFSLEQVRGFVAVAEELHFGRAAARLNMTQPPLSRQIQKLEDDVGVRLFERNARGVRLTEAGGAFYEDAVRLLRLAAAAPETARRGAAGWSGSVRMGFTGGSAFGILGAFLNRMSTVLPDVHLELAELVTSRQLEALGNGDLDFGLGRPPYDDSVFEGMLVRREDLVAAVPDGHRLAELGRRLHATDFAGADLIAHDPVQARYFADLSSQVLAGQHVRVAHTVTQLLTMILLVGAERGVALVPASAHLLGVAGVRFVPLEAAITPSVELHAIWLREATNPALRRIRALLRDLAAGSARTAVVADAIPEQVPSPDTLSVSDDPFFALDGHPETFLG